MSLKDMQKVIENNYSNMSLLSNKYLTPCVDAMQDSAQLNFLSGGPRKSKASMPVQVGTA